MQDFDHPKIAVFLGPSCSLEDARQILPQADYFPPAARGSIYRIINDGYRMIVLLDGLFYGQYSVWHKELLFAIDSGIDVLGATSMGALRAAELDGHGMVGFGQIYQWYRDGVIDGDDEVALLHQSGEGQYLALSVPLVNLRWALIGAVKAGVITTAQSDHIIAHAKSICFQDRTQDSILAPFAAQIDLPLLQTWLDKNPHDLKKTDAIAALRFAAARAVNLGPLPPVRLRDYEMIHSKVGIAYFSQERLTSICASPQGQPVPLAWFVDQIDVDDPRYGAYLRARAFQRLVNGWARELHLDLTPSASPTPWDDAVFDSGYRQATGLTRIDTAREARESALFSAVLGKYSTDANSDIVAKIDQRLNANGVGGATFARDIATLNGRLVFALWCLGREKGVYPDQSLPQVPADAALRYSEWIFAEGVQRFGYLFDPAYEVLLAHQYSNHMSDLALRVAS
jgi:hypothetical protein